MVVGRRDASTVATQALFLMNHPFVLEHAQHAARRLLDEEPSDDQARVERAFQLTLGRSPTVEERRIALGFVVRSDLDDRERAWALFVQSLFASIDFRYVN